MTRVADCNVAIRSVPQPVNQYKELKFSITSSGAKLQQLISLNKKTRNREVSLGMDIYPIPLLPARSATCDKQTAFGKPVDPDVQTIIAEFLLASVIGGTLQNLQKSKSMIFTQFS